MKKQEEISFSFYCLALPLHSFHCIWWWSSWPWVWCCGLSVDCQVCLQNWEALLSSMWLYMLLHQHCHSLCQPHTPYCCLHVFFLIPAGCMSSLMAGRFRWRPVPSVANPSLLSVSFPLSIPFPYFSPSSCPACLFSDLQPPVMFFLQLFYCWPTWWLQPLLALITSLFSMPRLI